MMKHTDIKAYPDTPNGAHQALREIMDAKHYKRCYDGQLTVPGALPDTWYIECNPKRKTPHYNCAVVYLNIDSAVCFADFEEGVSIRFNMIEDSEDK